MCGPFKAVGTSLATRLGDDTAQLSPIQRAALAHRVRSAKDAGGEPPLITSDWLERFLQNARLPSPSEQAIGIIRLIGENVENTGKPLATSANSDWKGPGIGRPQGLPRPTGTQRVIPDGIRGDKSGSASRLSAEIHLHDSAEPASAI
jgi:hypothetical protein